MDTQVECDPVKFSEEFSKPVSKWKPDGTDDGYPANVCHKPASDQLDPGFELRGILAPQDINPTVLPDEGDQEQDFRGELASMGCGGSPLPLSARHPSSSSPL